MPRAYPSEVSARIIARWNELGSTRAALPPEPALGDIVESAYHASFLNEEQRSLRFRLLVAAPTALPFCSPRDLVLQVLEFDPSRQLSDGELRRLAPAADFERTLIGVHAEGEGKPFIWGLASSGAQWLRDIQSGRTSRVEHGSVGACIRSRRARVAPSVLDDCLPWSWQRFASWRIDPSRFGR